MIKRQRLRKAVAPTLVIQKAGLLVAIGLLTTVVGAVMSFTLQIQMGVRWLDRAASQAISQYIDPLETDKWVHWTGALLILFGIFLVARAVRTIFVHVIETLNPSLKSSRVDVYVRRQQLALGPRIVALGGGTGLSTLLRGWKQHSSNITAIVTVTDDGGSSGKLVQQKGMLPPGDIRNCLVALADAEKAMTDLFQYRFRNDSGSLSGHAMGNLLITALVDQAQGDFERAISIASDVLAIRGQVMPSTLDHVGLKAVMDDGTEIFGETAIVEAGKRIQTLQIAPSNISAYPQAIEEILNADIICIGPGSVYTSVIPNLLVPGIAQALKKSEAVKVYVCNVMTQPGESDDFSASQHVAAILNQVKDRVFDYVMVNTAMPSQQALEKYREYGQHVVDPDIDRIQAMGFKVIQGNYMSETDVVRHDPMKVVGRLMSMMGH